MPALIGEAVVRVIHKGAPPAITVDALDDDALWKSEWYEAKLLAALIDDPTKVTAAQMDDWCTDFDNWATCDTACFALFDKTPHAPAKVKQWAKRKPEFERRAAFAAAGQRRLAR